MPVRAFDSISTCTSRAASPGSFGTLARRSSSRRSPVGQSVKSSLSTKVASLGRRRDAESGAVRRRKSVKKVSSRLFESWS